MAAHVLLTVSCFALEGEVYQFTRTTGQSGGHWALSRSLRFRLCEVYPALGHFVASYWREAHFHSIRQHFHTLLWTIRAPSPVSPCRRQRGSTGKPHLILQVLEHCICRGCRTRPQPCFHTERHTLFNLILPIRTIESIWPGCIGRPRARLPSRQFHYSCWHFTRYKCPLIHQLLDGVTWPFLHWQDFLLLLGSCRFTILFLWLGCVTDHA